MCVLGSSISNVFGFAFYEKKLEACWVLKKACVCDSLSQLTPDHHYKCFDLMVRNSIDAEISQAHTNLHDAGGNAILTTEPFGEQAERRHRRYRDLGS